MFSRSVVNLHHVQSASNNAQPGNGRRAFRDVTNATSGRIGANGKGTKIAKRSTTAGVKTRSMDASGGVLALTGAAFPNQGAFSQRSDDFRSNNNNNNPIVEQIGGSTTYNIPRSSFQADPNSYQMTGNTDNIDERDSDDPLCTTSYVQDMYMHFREKEVFTSVRPTYMETNQPHINERMRSILVDWLIEVHLKFKLIPETLYLTINLIDRYLQKEGVTRPRLQLLGVTSLLIASKYEEIYPPELRDLVYICDKAYTKQDILAMEESILKTLEYNVTIPSAHAFLVRYLKAGHADKKIVQLSCFLLDGTLQSYSLLRYLPSQLAAAAVFIARKVVGRNAWSPTLLKYAMYCEEEIIPVARAILQEKAAASSNSNQQELRAVTKKYSSNRYGGVSHVQLQCDF